MQVDFNLQRNDGTFITGKDLSNDPEAYRQELLSMRPIGGSISITTEKSTWTIEDEMGALMCNFCLGALPGLLQKGLVNYKFFEIYGTVDLQRIDGKILISGSFIETILVPEKLFFRLAFQCALRYIYLLKQYNEPQFENEWRLLEKEAIETGHYLIEYHPGVLK
jgi:hypothetical protein